MKYNDDRDKQINVPQMKYNDDRDKQINVPQKPHVSYLILKYEHFWVKL